MTKSMNIYKPFEKDVPRGGVATLGFFDGVHLGHKAIFKRVLDEAEKNNNAPFVATLWPHPRIVLGKNPETLLLINTLEEKTSLIAKSGFSHFVVIPFSEQLASLSAEEFFKTYFVEWLGISTLIVGYDHRIGRNGSGDFETMAMLGKKYGINVEKIEAQTYDHVSISSTKIRQLILQGSIRLANEYLGYSYFISGIVEKGFQLGRTIGFPTANIKVADAHKLVPADGVYAVKVSVDGLELNGMLNIGYRPTISKDQHKTIEVNIFDFDSTIYGSQLSIKFIDRIRDEMKFSGVEELTQQLKADREKAKQLLISNPLK
jgi:riboflavin kinase/FMN adenylyltransferase